MPLAVLDVVRSIACFSIDIDVEEESVKGPAGKRHVAVLFVEWEVTDVDSAWAFEDNLGEPCHITVMFNDCIGGDSGHLGPNVGVVA